MTIRRTKPLSFPKKLNEEGTLYEVGTRDVWQAELITNEGSSVGRIIREVIDPTHYAVRYLMVNLTDVQRLVLVPAVSVIGVDAGIVLCNLYAEEIYRLPEFVTEDITKEFEHQVFAAVDRSPYWVNKNSDGVLT